MPLHAAESGENNENAFEAGSLPAPDRRRVPDRNDLEPIAVSHPEPRHDDPLVILIARNFSEQKGGEAMKSLQIFQELERRGFPVHQITHDYNANEMKSVLPDRTNISYLETTRFQHFCVRTQVLRSLFLVSFYLRAARLARQLSEEHPNAVVHINQPVSPVMPMFLPGGNVPVLIGPVNGNIYYPPGLKDRQPWSWTIRKRLHRLVQTFNRVFLPGRRRADLLLVAGGERTAESLRMAGCRDDRMRPSLDSGIPDHLRELPRIAHRGPNHRFVHNGRLAMHKGADLIIKALPRTKTPATLDLIGRGEDEERLRQLTKELGLEDRVNFLPWFKDHRQVAEALRAYRGFVLPSLAEANGIVVQEAMMMGLPSICLDWGGPQLLLDESCGFLVDPKDEDAVLSGIAEAMDRLGEDDALAERMSIAGREKALREGYCWSELIDRFIEAYRELAAGNTRRLGSGSGSVPAPDHVRAS